MNVLALGIELGCVAAGQLGTAMASRWLGRGPDSPATVLLAAPLIPFWLLYSLRVVPPILLAAGRAVAGRAGQATRSAAA